MKKRVYLFGVGSANLPVAIQIRFTNAICFVFMISAILSIPAIIVSAMRGKEDLDQKKSGPDGSSGE